MEINTDPSGNSVVWFGEYGICQSPREGKLWIEHTSGEGMDVDESHFVEWLREYYSDNF